MITKEYHYLFSILLFPWWKSKQKI